MRRGAGQGAKAPHLALVVATTLELVACGAGGAGGEAPLIDLGPGEAARVVALPPPTGERKVEGPIPWMADVSTARARARRDERPLLVLVVAEWSVGSVELERGTFSAPRVVQAARGAVALRLDLTDTEATVRLAEAFRVTAVPTVIVLGPSGEERYRSVEVDEAELILALTRE